jgi:peptidyl-prolyl cis-trans isomerase C
LRITAAALFLSTPVFAQDADTVVATVNGTDITLGQMISVRETLPQQYQQLQPSVLFSGILDQLVQQTLLAQTVEGDISKRSALTLQVQRTAVLANEAIANEIAKRVDETAIQAMYDVKYGNFEGSPEFNASHILVETEEEAQAIATEIRAGADFAETAKEKSTGPSGPRGGALGWFGPGQMVPEFEQAVTELSVGEVSNPVQTQFGWHVIILNESRTQPAPTLEEVRGELEIDVENEIASAYIAELSAEADVDRSAGGDLDPALISRFDLLEN